MNNHLKILSLIAVLLLASCAGLQSRFHSVRPGETLFSISRTYGVTVKDLKSVNPRRMAQVIYPGDKIYIPFEQSPDYGNGPTFSLGSKTGGTKAVRGDRQVASVSKLSWPVNGRLSGFFGLRGRRRHEGIDIAAPRGTPVRAVKDGKVIYRGNKLRGYGNVVILRHPGGMTTVYAHMSRFNVKHGQWVKRGRSIGKVGSTGRSSGNHLHFEVRHDHEPVNPLLYLQGRYAANILTP